MIYTKEQWDKLTSEQQWTLFNECQLDGEKLYELFEAVPSVDFPEDDLDAQVGKRLTWIKDQIER